MALPLAALTMASCATPQRLPAVPQALTERAVPSVGPLRFLVARDAKPFADEAVAALHKEQAYLAARGMRGPLPPAYYLAISGGGDNGAFGAGLLNGWSENGTRPQFKLVTGISTGALIAPFAFMGSDYDGALKAVYTTISQRDIMKKRGLLKGFFADALADTAPLAKLVERFVDQKLLDAIAAEYGKGRLLLVATTDLDALEPVVWNMTAIAASREPGAADLFRKILVASASIPGVFPPMMIDVTANGARHQEMHVDGGTIAQVFLYPPAIKGALSEPIGARQRTMFLIRNARLDADWASVERRTLPVAARAIASLTQTQGVGDLYRIFVTTQRDGIDYNLAFIPPSFDTPHKEDFDTVYMQQLFELGRRMAANGYPWSKVPPGYDTAPR